MVNFYPQNLKNHLTFSCLFLLFMDCFVLVYYIKYIYVISFEIIQGVWLLFQPEGLYSPQINHVKQILNGLYPDMLTFKSQPTIVMTLTEKLQKPKEILCELIILQNLGTWEQDITWWLVLCETISVFIAMQAYKLS